MSFNKRMKQKGREEDKRNNDDDSDGSEEAEIKHLFRSALDVGSTFIKVIPDDEDLIFYYTKDNKMQAKVYCENTTETSTIAWFAWTSNKNDISIEPEYGFIRPGGYAYIKFISENYEEVEKGLFFIKALPLASNLDIDELEEEIDDVFHEHNKNILFTISTLSGGYNLDERADQVVYNHHVDRENLIYTSDYKQSRDSNTVTNT